MDRGPWWATVHRVTESWTQLKGLNTQTHRHCFRSDTQVGDILPSRGHWAVFGDFVFVITGEVLLASDG